MGITKIAFVALGLLILYLFVTADTSPASCNHSCSTSELDVLSCSSASLTTNSCCVESPGGLLIVAQLYNFNPGLGPGDSWTMHGLWPDLCNGSYPSSCDPSRAYTDIPAALKRYKQYPLLEYMTEWWRNDPIVTTENGTDADLWAHEFGKHGTCMSTLHPDCYHRYQPELELVDFYSTSVRLFKELPTAEFLAACDIIPSNATTYDLADIEECLSDATGGFTPHMGCSEITGYLNEVWYYGHLRGRIGGGTFEGTNSTFKSTCSATGIRYPLKLNSGY
ncbi:ribonuclease t2 [Venturia nashicola]|uniref:ribonuclease T2 n=1 Tax=Venturia nashicola TaxID=86259 RepID=A0A4Z1PEY1_9PEZI|nr:ribonuclease t2 [Venturia nashicola]TLD36409.1 ribonuclease t2 [Venturia nashicola]